MLIGIDASRAAWAKRTGTENYSLQLIRGLLSLPGNHNYRLYTNGLPPPEIFPRSLSAEIRPLSLPRLWTQVRLSWEVAFHPPDVLFVPAHVLPLVSPSKAVITIHDLGYRFYPWAHSPFSCWHLHFFTRRSLQMADEIIAVSAATRNDLIRLYGEAANRITVIHHGLDHERFHPIKDARYLEDVRKRYGIPPLYLLHLGTIHPRKNLGVIFEAVAEMRAQDSDIALVLAGKLGWRGEEVLAQAGEGVLHLGYVADEDVPALVSGACALVMPSLYEGFGMPVLEAMACGTPVVCSRASSLPEVAGDAALLVDPHEGDAWTGSLSRVLSDADLREELVARGLARASQFSWERCARETLGVLERAGGTVD